MIGFLFILTIALKLGMHKYNNGACLKYCCVLSLLGYYNILFFLKVLV